MPDALPPQIQAAIEREAEQEHGALPSSDCDAWRNSGMCSELRRFIAYGQRIARLTLEAERERVTIVPLAQVVSCRQCGGAGQLAHRTPVGRHTIAEYWVSEMQPCEFCGGSGNMWQASGKDGGPK